MNIDRLAELYYIKTGSIDVKWDESLNDELLFVMSLGSQENKDYNKTDCVYNLLVTVAQEEKPYSYLLEELSHKETLGRYSNIINQWKIIERFYDDIFTYKNKDKIKLLQKTIDEDLLKIKYIASKMNVKYDDFHYAATNTPGLIFKGLHVWKKDGVEKLALWKDLNRDRLVLTPTGREIFRFIGGTLLGVPLKENWAINKLSKQDFIDFFGNDLANKIMSKI